MKRILLIAALGGAALTAWPYELLVQQVGVPLQDDWVIPPKVHEIGVMPVFPPDEALLAWDAVDPYIPCPTDYIPGGPPNYRVSIVNLTGTYWKDVWYVGDVETAFSNVDELVGCPGNFVWLSFKIDKVGLNTPLVFESLTQDSIWEPGEQWDFIIQNYVNSWNGPASAFGSLNIAWCSRQDMASTGSIIAVPEPAWGFAGMALAGLAAVRILRRRS